MKFVILGAGALGSVFAGHLARAGEDVSLIARGARARYLNEQGITVTGLADFNVDCRVIIEPRDIQQADVLIVAVKTYDTASALESVRHLEVPVVLSLQNGVLKDIQLADTFGYQNTLGAAAFTSAEMTAEGPVSFTVNQALYVGELPEGTSKRVQRLVDVLVAAGIAAEESPHIQTTEWSKFAVWVGGMAASVLTRLATHKFFSDPDSAIVCSRLIREMGSLAVKLGIPLEDTPPFPVKTICSISEEESVGKIREMGALFEAKMPNHRMSTLQDLERGGSLEVEETLGYVVAKAAEEDITVPTVDTCYRLISGINRSL